MTESCLREKTRDLNDFPRGDKRGLSSGLARAPQIGLYHLVADAIPGAVRKTKCWAALLLRGFVAEDIGTDLVETAHLEGLAQNGFGTRCLFGVQTAHPGTDIFRAVEFGGE